MIFRVFHFFCLLYDYPMLMHQYKCSKRMHTQFIHPRAEPRLFNHEVGFSCRNVLGLGGSNCSHQGQRSPRCPHYRDLSISQSSGHARNSVSTSLDQKKRVITLSWWFSDNGSSPVCQLTDRICHPLPIDIHSCPRV